MRDLYIKNAHAFIYVYSILSKPTFNDLHDIRHLVLRVRDTLSLPTILVGNKVHKEEYRVVTKEEGMQLAKEWNVPFFETSVKYHVNVNEIFFEAVREAKRMNFLDPNLGDRTVSMIGKKLKSFPSQALVPTILNLDLSNNKISTIPSTNYPYLIELDLSRNRITAIPDSISQLTALEILNVSGNEINNIPPTFKSLLKLHRLDLSKNRISTIPQEFCALSNLVNLNIANNSISFLPTSFFDHFPYLKELNLEANNITNLPPNISCLTSLESLDISNIGLTNER